MPLCLGKQNALCYFYSIAGRTGLWKYGFDLYKLQNNFHCSVALSLANLDDTCIAALAVSILGSDSWYLSYVRLQLSELR